MLPKKIYLNYVDENDEDKTWSEEPISVYDCKMQNREYTDLSQVWHDASEEPKEDGWILVQFGTDTYDTLALPRDLDVWRDFVKMHHFVRWAYISDLLPKGGEQ